MISAMFLDRDGVINVNIRAGYVTSPAILTILPGASEAIKRLNDASIPVIIISNQQGVGKGLMSRADLDSVDSALRARITECSGGVIDRSYYCTHLSSENCDCRKPLGGQLRRAAKEFEIDLTNAVFVGDAKTDILAGKDASVGHMALVLAGANGSYAPGVWPEDPDSVHRDLAAAVEWLLTDAA